LLCTNTLPTVLNIASSEKDSTAWLNPELPFLACSVQESQTYLKVIFYLHVLIPIYKCARRNNRFSPFALTTGTKQESKLPDFDKIVYTSFGSSQIVAASRQTLRADGHSQRLRTDGLSDVAAMSIRKLTNAHK
jgi:hypothetical protein